MKKPNYMCLHNIHQLDMLDAHFIAISDLELNGLQGCSGRGSTIASEISHMLWMNAWH